MDSMMAAARPPLGMLCAKRSSTCSAYASPASQEPSGQPQALSVCQSRSDRRASEVEDGEETWIGESRQLRPPQGPR